MKTLLFSFSFLFAAGTALAQTTQVINSNIRAEIQFWQFYTTADGDDSAVNGEDDLAVKLNMTLLPSGFEYNELCFTWNCDAPCQVLSGVYYWFSNRSFEERFTVDMEAWESDNTPWCTYNSSTDDYHWSGSATLANNGRITDAKETVWDYNNGPVGAFVFYGSPNFDATPRIAWRYVAGETLDNPLQFGSLTPGQIIEHSGTNLPNPLGVTSDLDLGWQDNGGNASPDVFFSFSLAQTSEVKISTFYNTTDFDTYLRLYNSQGAIIAENDEIPGSQQKAFLTVTLNPGTYRFMLEGGSNVTGNYKFTINTTAASAAEEQFAPADWSVFPNPAKDRVTVNIQSDDLDAGARLSVHDLFGRELLAQDARAGAQELDLSAFDPGVYAVQIRSGNAAGVRKVVVE